VFAQAKQLPSHLDCSINMTQPGSTGDTGYTSGKGAMKAPSRAEVDQKVDDKTTVMEGSELAGLSVGVRTALARRKQGHNACAYWDAPRCHGAGTLQASWLQTCARTDVQARSSTLEPHASALLQQEAASAARGRTSRQAREPCLARARASSP